MKTNGERAHSKLSASGSERWFACPASVKLSEGLPDKTSVYAAEGTRAHAVLEKIMLAMISNKAILAESNPMFHHGLKAAQFIQEIQCKAPHSELMVETRVYLDFIHPEMFGTFDGAVVDHFGTLHVFDYKYGAGHAVVPTNNLQMIFYGIGLAHKFHWNFKDVRLWIIQPRIKGFDGPMFWQLPIMELKKRVDDFKQAVERVERFPDKVVEGSWCHWCRAKSICPAKRQEKISHAKNVFTAV